METIGSLIQRTVQILDEVKIFHNPVTLKKGNSLLNKHIKKAFLEILGAKFSAFDITVMNWDGDAGVVIVASALTVAKTCPVKLLGEDTHVVF